MDLSISHLGILCHGVTARPQKLPAASSPAMQIFVPFTSLSVQGRWPSIQRAPFTPLILATIGLFMAIDIGW